VGVRVNDGAGWVGCEQHVAAFRRQAVAGQLQRLLGGRRTERYSLPRSRRKAWRWRSRPCSRR
jgi:hypothetical protein